MAEHDRRVGAASTPVDGPDPVRDEPAGGHGADRFVVEGRDLVGVALDLMPGPDDLRIALVGRSGEVRGSFGPFEEEDVVAIWRSVAASTGLVPMMRNSEGEIEALATQIGRLRVGRLHDRRGRPLVGRRRPVSSRAARAAACRTARSYTVSRSSRPGAVPEPTDIQAAAPRL